MTVKLAGWVPIRVYQAEAEQMVDWCYLGDRTFTAPFFDQTIGSCLEHPFNLLFRRQTPVRYLVEHHHEHPGLGPSGFIFHMSRAGSTLISRMFATLPQNIVISEARPVDGMLQTRFHSASVSEEENIEWLRALFGALGQPRCGAEEHLFVKFEAWHVLLLPLIRKAFPEVPWIFAYRDPIDVLVSQLAQPGQMIPGFLYYHLFGPDANRVLSLPPEDCQAVLLAAFCNAALAGLQAGGLLINYTELPAAVGSSISQFFKLRWTDAELASMTRVTTRHSKEQRVFKPDSAKKQEQATDAVRHAAERWLYPIHDKLESVRLGRAEGSD